VENHTQHPSLLDRAVPEVDDLRLSRVRMAQQVHRALAADPALEIDLRAGGASDPAALLLESLLQASVFRIDEYAQKPLIDDSVRDLVLRLL
jgi:hypothetical protein